MAAPQIVSKALRGGSQVKSSPIIVGSHLFSFIHQLGIEKNRELCHLDHLPTLGLEKHCACANGAVETLMFVHDTTHPGNAAFVLFVTGVGLDRRTIDDNVAAGAAGREGRPGRARCRDVTMSARMRIRRPARTKMNVLRF